VATLALAMQPLDKVETIADVQLLPSYVQNAIRTQSHNPHGFRRVENINKAERKLAIQSAVARAIKEGMITERLAVEILTANNAYGPKGRKAIEATKP